MGAPVNKISSCKPLVLCCNSLQPAMTILFPDHISSEISPTSSKHIKRITKHIPKNAPQAPKRRQHPHPKRIPLGMGRQSNQVQQRLQPRNTKARHSLIRVPPRTTCTIAIHYLCNTQTSGPEAAYNCEPSTPGTV